MITLFKWVGNIMSKLTFEKPSIYTPPETNQLGFNYSSDSSLSFFSLLPLLLLLLLSLYYYDYGIDANWILLYYSIFSRDYII